MFYQNRRIKEINLSNFVITIGEHAFDKCTGITDITLESTILTTINECAFAETAIS